VVVGKNVQITNRFFDNHYVATGSAAIDDIF
jgi:hypothetical protein